MSERTGEQPGARRAVALGYRREVDAAPRVVASGAGAVAEQILARAEQAGVPVEHDPDLMACLAPLAVGVEIPPHAFAAVASVLAFVYRANDAARGVVPGPSAR